MPRKKDPIAEARKKALILQAAKLCFAQSGFHAVTMRQIIEASGLSAGGVYYHFTGKEDLVAAIAAEERAGMDQLLSRLRLEKDARAGLIRFVADLLLWTSQTDALLATEIFAEACRSEAIQVLVKENDQLLERAVSEAVHRAGKQGTVRVTLSLEHETMLVIALLEGFWGKIAQGLLTSREASSLAKQALARLFPEPPVSS